MYIALIGHTGSGKSTLARWLSETYGLPHISSGDVSRKLAASDPSTRLALDSGAYAPEGAIRIKLREAIEHHTREHGGYVLEGFPRKLEQLVALNQWSEVEPTYVLIDTPVLICMRRLAARARTDDIPDGIARKIRQFWEQTLPMIQVLEEAGSLIRVHNGSNNESYARAQLRKLMR